MTTTNPNKEQTMSPTQIEFFANHSDAALRKIVDEKTAASLWTAQQFGADHPMAVEALAIANAAWGQLATRYTGTHSKLGAGQGDRDHFAGKHFGDHSDCPHCTKTCALCALDR